MGTITKRRRRDGSTGYTAQIRLKRDGRLVHSESETFDREALAREWLRRREAELDQARARGEPPGRRVTVAELVAWYRHDTGTLANWGRTKTFDLAALAASPLGTARADRLTAADIIAHVRARRAGGAGPATAGNDLIWLRQVLRAARLPHALPLTALQALDDAAAELRRQRVVGKPRRRDRRLLPAEETALLAHFASRDARSQIPMADVVRFAMATTRRQEEITRIRWDDLDRDAGIAWLDDVKHPTHKAGNRRAFRVLSTAWAIIDRQPRTAAEVFPFDPKSIGAAFTRATRLLGITDLRFHDLRHEATSRLFEAGYSIQEVAQFTLHDSWTTLKRYTHLRPEHVPERGKETT